METIEDMKNMHGKQGSELLHYCTYNGDLLQDWNIQEITRHMSDSQIERFKKYLKPVIRKWIWKFAYDHSGNPMLYATDEHLYNLDGSVFQD